MSAAPRRIAVEERRARLARRHHLLPAARARTVVEVANDLVGLHASDPPTPFLAAAARLHKPESAIVAMESALYEDRVMLRILAMRRTMFVVPVELAPVLQAASGRAIAAQQRRLMHQLLEPTGVARDIPAWLRRVEGRTLQAIADRGEATAAELSRAEPLLQTKVLLAEGKKYEARLNITGRLLLILAAEGHLSRGRPLGSWVGSQWRWAPIEGWFPNGMPVLDTAVAQAEVVQRWLYTFGPATPADIKWWTGWPARDVNRALSAILTADVDLDGVPGLVLADDVDPVRAGGHWVALLPALDPTAMGWTARDWFLGPHRGALFDSNGNVGPTVWSDGRIVGGWAQRKDGEIAFRLLEDVGREGTAKVERETAALRARIGDVRFTPRFRTPLEKELAA